MPAILCSNGWQELFGIMMSVCVGNNNRCKKDGLKQFIYNYFAHNKKAHNIKSK
jgi:hypothetical protein